MYTYDAGSNITTCKTYAYTEADTVTGTAKTTETYTYGNSAWKDQLTEYRGQKIRYDAMGNPISYRGMTMEWEQGRKLKKITGNGVTQSHSYDADGIRIRKVVNGVTTQFYTNGTSILAQKSSDGTRLDFLYDDQGKLFAMEYEGERYFYKKNIQGDITGLVDKTGTEVVTYTYNTWGLLTGTTDRSGKGLAGKNPFRYREYYYDVELGLYYVSSRYYDPETRRFVNADDPEIICEAAGGLTDKNLYTYCDNNLVTRRDADGCFWNIATGALIGAAISGGIELAAQLGEHMIFGSKVDFKSVAIATISGAVGGALAASDISESGQMIGNAVISSVTEVVSQVSAGNKNVKNIALNACAMGVLGGYVGKKGGDGVRKKGSAYEKNISTLKDLRKNPIYKSMKPKKYNRKVWRAKAKNKKLKKMVTIATTKFTVRWTWRTTGISHSRNWVKKIKEQFGW